MATMVGLSLTGLDRTGVRGTASTPTTSACAMAVASALGLALLSGCAGVHEEAQVAPPVVRAPVRYVESIVSFFNVTMPRNQRNGQLSVGTPELGGCPVGGRANGARGWVVPVTYSTRTGDPGKPGGISITAKQYYVWFREDTIYGVLGKPELCP
jgi:hypothetical protein